MKRLSQKERLQKIRELNQLGYKALRGERTLTEDARA